MDSKDKIEALKFISQVHRSQFDERRKYEWKIVFTSLTFYVLCVAAKYDGIAKFPSSYIFKLIVWAMFLLFAVLVAGFLSSLHTANDKNKNVAQWAENAIVSMLENQEENPIPPKFSLPLDNTISWGNLFKRNIDGIWAWRWQVVTLLFFAVASAYLLTLECEYAFMRYNFYTVLEPLLMK